MKKTVHFSDFCDEFTQSGRGDSYSYAGLQALYDWITDYEEDTGEEIELDVIALCCEWTEYEDIEEFWDNYDKEDFPDLESVEEHTHVIRLNDDSFIIADF